MTALPYHRPQSLEEALELLEHGTPLAGGTQLTPSLRGIEALVDLQDLGLDELEIGEGVMKMGGTATLQALVAAASQLPADLVQVARLEAGWNIRNKATVAGTIVTGDGRSPLLTVLLAMATTVEFAPGGEQVPFEDVLRRGTERTGGKLITSIRSSLPTDLLYAQVARSPADRPQVCVAVGAGTSGVSLALGGFGMYPKLLQDVADPEQAGEWARSAYADAGDQWASAAYRSAAAGALAARLVDQVASG